MTRFLRLAVLSFIFALAGCCSMTEPATPAAPTRPEYHAMRSTVVLLRKVSSDAWEGSACAATFVGPKRLATADHCTQPSSMSPGERWLVAQGFLPMPELAGRDVAFVAYDDWVKAKGVLEASHVRKGKIVERDMPNDVAVIEAEEAVSTWAQVRTAPLAWSEFVFTIGHPESLVFTMTRGFVAMPTRVIAREDIPDRPGRFTQITISVAGGNSGGGLFDSSGNFVGICSGSMEAQHLSFFAHLSNVRAALGLR